VTTSDELRLERHRRYNLSVKGQKRRQRYEAKHPERKERWSPIMLIKARDKR
jgi:hypothetical protein